MRPSALNKTTANSSCCFAAKEIYNPLGPFRFSPWGEDEGEGFAVRCATLLCMILTLPLSLAKGEATRVRGAYSIYQNAN
jgi:hypothetical protein